MATAESPIRKLAAHLRKTAPTLLPVRVCLRDFPKVSGFYREVGYASLIPSKGAKKWSHFRVVLDQRRPIKAIQDTLVHEWAHCLTWEEGELVETDHGPSFKRAHRRVRRILRAWRASQ